MATMKRRVDRLLSSQTAVGGRRPEAEIRLHIIAAIGTTAMERNRADGGVASSIGDKEQLSGLGFCHRQLDQERSSQWLITGGYPLDFSSG